MNDVNRVSRQWVWYQERLSLWKSRGSNHCSCRCSVVTCLRGRNSPRTTKQKGCGRTMPYLLIRHKIANYEMWKPGFDAHSATRQASGSKGGQLFRNASDPNEMVVLLKWDDLEKARQFTQSDELREVMQRLGVIDHPDIYFLEEVEQVSR